MQEIWFYTKQTFFLVFLRRLRTLPMLLLLALLFVLMALKANWVLGAPYLFWHDDFWWVGFFSLLGVGLFLEEWSFVAVLLDTDENNPINSSLPGTQGSPISLMGGVKRFLGINTTVEPPSSPEDISGDTAEDSETQSVPTERDLTDSEKRDVFLTVRRIHSYATYSLAFLFGFFAAFTYQLLNENLFAIQQSQYLASLFFGFFMMVFVYSLFLVRRLILVCGRYLTSLSKVLHRTISLLPKFGKALADWIFGEIVKEESLFGKFHLIAFFKNAFSITVVIMISILYWYGISGGADISVAFLVCTVLSMVLGVYGWIVFQRRRMRYEIVASAGVLLALVSVALIGNVPQEVRMHPQTEAKKRKIPASPFEALDEVKQAATQQLAKRSEWKDDIASKDENRKPVPATEESLLIKWRESARNSQFAVGGESPTAKSKIPKPIMVIVTNTGGGIKAQVWSSVVLCALENQFALPNDKGARTQFSRHVRLITGASGGMVGAGYWTATLAEKNHLDGKKIYFHQEGENNWMSTESLIERMSRDCLSRVARQGFYNDLLGLPLRLARIDRLFEERIPTRGEALEEALIEFGPSFGQAFKELKTGEDEGWRPTLVYTPTSATDGRRLLVCNQPLEYLFYTKFGNYPADGFVQDDNESNPLYSWRVNYPGSGLKLATAARMSANFPIFVDSPYLPFTEEKHRIRIMDAGYTDNHGMYPAAVWINENREWIKENTSGLLLVEISAGPLPRQLHPSLDNSGNPKPVSSFVPEALGFVTTSFNKTLYHSDRILKNAADYLNTEKDFFRVATFAYNGEASLSWYLSNVERLSLVYPFLSDKQVKSLLQDRDDVKLKESIPSDLIITDTAEFNESSLARGADRYTKPRFDKSEIERAANGKKLKAILDWWKNRLADRDNP